MKPWNDKRVVVTGGTGFLGSHLVGALREAGARVSDVSREQATLEQVFQHYTVESGMPVDAPPLPPDGGGIEPAAVQAAPPQPDSLLRSA